jgi:Domain of unknown function (DUF4376)
VNQIKIFRPQNWYWKVAGSPGVYSSASNIYVPETDTIYVTWLGAGYTASQINSECEIWSYVSPYLSAWLFNGTTFAQPAVGTYMPAQLSAYAASLRYTKETEGIAVNGAAVATDRESQAMINGAYNMATRDPTFTTQWKMATGAFVQIDATTIASIATAVGAHVATCFAKEATVAAGIAGGTIKTPADIDAAFAGV